MNLGAGLAAADGFFAGQEHTQDRDYLQQQRDFQTKQNQASLDMLPDQVAATKSGYQATTAKNAAALDVLPGQTENTKKAIAVQGAGLDRDILQDPEKEKQRVSDNAQADQARHMQSLATLGTLFSTGDKAGALKHVNAVAKNEAASVGTAGKTFVDIVPNTTDKTYDLVADDGSKVAIPADSVSKAMSMAKTGEYKAIKGDDGSLYTINTKTGDVQTKVKGDPNSPLYGVNQHTPAQMQIAKAYQADNPGMSFTQAMEKVKTATTKPRHEGIMDLVGKTALPGADLEAEYKKWARIYDMAVASSNPGGKSAPSSNSPATPTINLRDDLQTYLK